MDIKGFEISGKERSLEDTIGKLKFLSRIKDGEKVCVATLSIVKPDYYSRACRSMSGETRDDTMLFVKETVKRAIELAHYYAEDYEDSQFNKDVTNLITKNISEARKGLENLCKTYNNDVKFTTELETLFETIDIKLKKEK